MKSLKLSVFETSLGDAWKPLAEGIHPNCAGKLPESAQLALDD
jgi:hypothetical protein